ncbi:MAG: radical SAM protein [Bacteroidota bacterium]|nr:radical SAM protein [Bacteroidota bacterium]
MYDLFNREINYLRISVTDRCNLACTYCMPSEHIGRPGRAEMLSIQEIAEVVQTLAPLGISKIRLTGGEPLLRAGIEELVGMINEVEGIKELAMTTNGQGLAGMAQVLARNGLKRVNISLDTLDPVRYREITRGGEMRKVMKGIDASLEAGLIPVKINSVLTPDSDPVEMEALQEFCDTKGLELRFIRQMDLQSGKFWRVEGGQGGHCNFCNRMRLTVDGRFIPCLFSEKEYSIIDYGIVGAFEKAILNKPRKGMANTRSTFYRIGG